MSGPHADDVRSMWPQPQDSRPEFNPAYFVVAAVRLLAEHGVEVRIRDSMIYPAEIAAGDFLRAIGVRPANAPRRGQPKV